MSKVWKNPPPVLAIVGSDTFLTARALQNSIAAVREQGRTVTHIDGEDQEALLGCLSGGFLFSDEQLIVVEKPVKADLDLIWQHHKEGDSDVVLVLYVEGALKKTTRLWKKVISKLPKGSVWVFDKPAFYKQEDYAIQFVVTEAKRQGKGISKDVAGALVRTVGVDLGVLSFEVFKAVCLLNHMGMETIGRQHVVKTVANMGAEDVNGLLEAVGRMQPAAILQKTAQIKKGYSGDPTIMVCRRVGNQALKWLQASALVARGLPVNEAARVMGVNPFYYQKSILPIATAWSKEVFLRLFHNVVGVEKGLKKGHINPWVELETLLVVTAHMARRGR